MFSAPKLAKTKPLTSPSNMNSSKKYVTDLAGSNMDLRNRSFDTAQSLYRRAASGSGQSGQKNMRQTYLGIRKCSENDENQQSVDSNKPAKKANEFFLMPLPRDEKVQHATRMPRIQAADDAVTTNPLNKSGRSALVLLGKVDFCLKMHKLYATTNAVWSVFAKVVKTFEGKNRFELILLLRNFSDDGPVLKCFYYDFGDGVHLQIHAGDTLRVVGRFENENNFRAHKIEKWNLEKSSADFSRIQNVISFVLLQQHAQDTAN